MFNKKIMSKQRGIILSDAVIAILIILLFAGIMTSLIINIVLESAKIKMNSQHIEFATEILEYVEILPYESVTQENLIKYINDKDLDYVSADATVDTLTTPYKIGIQVEKYNAREGNEDKLDIIKIVTLTIQNSLNQKEYSTEVSRIKKATINEIKIMLDK